MGETNKLVSRGTQGRGQLVPSCTTLRSYTSSHRWQAAEYELACEPVGLGVLWRGVESDSAGNAADAINRHYDLNWETTISTASFLFFLLDFGQSALNP